VNLPGARVEIALNTPWSTRPDVNDWQRIDIADPIAGSSGSALRAAHTKRGVRTKTGEPEASYMTVVCDNTHGELTRSNTAGPWYPNLKHRRRVRVILEPEGEDPITLLTGFIDRFHPTWNLDHAEMTLELVDLLAVAGTKPLPDSVYEHVTRELGAVSYWPFAPATRDVEDIIDRYDLTLDVDPHSTDPLLAYAPAQGQIIGWIDTENISQVARHPSVPVADDATFVFWVRFDKVSTFQSIWPWYQRNSEFSGKCSIHLIKLYASNPYTIVAVQERGAAPAVQRSFEAVISAADLEDSRAHMIAVTFSAGTAANNQIWFDGVKLERENFTSITTGTSFGFAAPAWIGTALGPPPGETVAGLQFGHLARFDRVLDDAEIAELYAAGVAPWDGDTTGERIERLCLAAGIDAADLDLDVGVAVCGPATLGTTLGEQLDKVVATELGALFCTADGKIRFLARPSNDQTATVTFAGTEDDGIPYVDVDVEDSLDRTINTARATRDVGEPQEVIDRDSVDEYGTLGVQVATVARTPGGARAVAARLVHRSSSPREIVTGLRINGRHTHVGTDIFTVDVHTAVSILTSPAGLEEPQLSLIEGVEHTVDWVEQTIVTVLAATPWDVWPTFQWDMPGRGWDRAVWGA
jgi:hypothetical protein